MIVDSFSNGLGGDDEELIVDRFVRPARIHWVPVLLVAAGVIVALFSVSRRPRNAATEIDSHQLNVLLITVDTTRADRLHCYGCSEIDTPNIDRLAAEGVRFAQCATPVPLTLPAHTSIMTGLYPFATRVRLNDANPVYEKNVTLAEILKEKGYRTAAFIGASVLDRDYRLNQGFEDYVDLLKLSFRDERMHPSRLFPSSESSQRRGDEMADLTIRWLKTHGAERRFFIWAHFFDPHAPYDPPEPFASQYPDRYLGEIAFMDQQIGRVLDELDRLHLADRTLVVLAADHGEGCGEHGEDTHAWFVYDATLHVPLLFRLPHRLGPNKLVAAQVRLVDIMPTVLDLLGCEIPANINGTSLVPLMDGKTDDLHLEAYAESLNAYSAFNYAWLRALRADGWKYVLAPKPELYDLNRDPAELNNVIDAHPDKAAEFRERLRDIIADTPIISPDSGSDDAGLTTEQRGRLATLGYVTGPGKDLSTFDDEMSAFDPVGVDPKDRLEVISQWTRALGPMMAGADEQAIPTLQALAEKEPQVATFPMWLGKVFVHQGRLDEAKASLERALALAPDCADVHQWLAKVDARRGDADGALQHMQTAASLAPQDPATLRQYASLLTNLERHQDALPVIERCAELTDHADPTVEYDLAQVLIALGEDQRAEEALRTTLRLDPDFADAHYDLGNILARRGNNAEALTHYQRAVAADPNFAEAQLKLGIELTGLGRTGQAAEALVEALRVDPSLEEAYARLGQLLLAAGRHEQAAEVLTRGFQYHPDNLSFAMNLATLLVFSPDDGLRDGARAVEIMQSALKVADEETPELLNLLAAAQAEAGRFDEAVATAQQAADLAEQQGKDDLLQQICERREKYEQGQTAR